MTQQGRIRILLQGKREVTPLLCRGAGVPEPEAWGVQGNGTSRRMAGELLADWGGGGAPEGTPPAPVFLTQPSP